MKIHPPCAPSVASPSRESGPFSVWNFIRASLILATLSGLSSALAFWKAPESRGTQLRLRGTDPVASPRPLSPARNEKSAGKYKIALSQLRAIDGSNSGATAGQGAVNSQLLRKATADYPDDRSGTEIIAPPQRPNARTVSNRIAAQGATELPNSRDLTNYVWAWGQFIDHDLDLTNANERNGTADVPIEDPNDPLGPHPVPFDRSDFLSGSGKPGIPREHANVLTAFIDASQVYGSSDGRAQALRTLQGGRLKTSEHDLLPFNLDGIDNAGGPDPSLFVAGDVRVNENVMLCAMHTLFVREHNRLATLLALLDPTADDEHLYQLARKIVMRQMQVITYREFLPALLGQSAPKPSELMFRPQTNPGVTSEFSTALFRVGHTLLSSNLPLAENGALVGGISLQSGFFNPGFIANDPANVDRLLEGFGYEPAQEIDTKVIDDVRNFLFGPPGAGGLDLAVLNIQRGRDHGLADYNTTRAAYGLSRVRSFAEITSDVDAQETLEELYGTVDNIDVWIGALAEERRPGDGLGPLLTAGVRDQFIRSAAGDRFFGDLDADLQQPAVYAVIDLDQISLPNLIRTNSTAAEVPEDCFVLSPRVDADVMLSYAAIANCVHITGNHQDNHLVVLHLPFGILVVGQNGTLIDGASQRLLMTKNLPNLTVDLGAGDDSLTILFGSWADGLIRLGSGSNTYRSIFTRFAGLFTDVQP